MKINNYFVIKPGNLLRVNNLALKTSEESNLGPRGVFKPALKTEENLWDNFQAKLRHKQACPKPTDEDCGEISSWKGDTRRERSHKIT